MPPKSRKGQAVEIDLTQYEPQNDRNAIPKNIESAEAMAARHGGGRDNRGMRDHRRNNNNNNYDDQPNLEWNGRGSKMNYADDNNRPNSKRSGGMFSDRKNNDDENFGGLLQRANKSTRRPPPGDTNNT